MSKRKIDETMTEARNARAKRNVEEAIAPPTKRSKKANVTAGTKPEEPKPAKGETKEKAPKTPKQDLVVFAFRLKAAERDLIHKAAGAAKASRFVRALMIAASKGDEKTVLEIVRAAKEEMATAS